MVPNQRSETGQRPGQSLNLHPSWCRSIKITINPPGECDATQDRTSPHHPIRGPGPHAPWRPVHAIPAPSGHAGPAQGPPRPPQARGQDRARGQGPDQTPPPPHPGPARRPDDPRPLRHDLCGLMTIIAPPRHHGQGPGPDTGRPAAGTALAGSRPLPVMGASPQGSVETRGHAARASRGAGGGPSPPSPPSLAPP